jgi:hypothetical protein
MYLILKVEILYFTYMKSEPEFRPKNFFVNYKLTLLKHVSIEESHDGNMKEPERRINDFVVI